RSWGQMARRVKTRKCSRCRWSTALQNFPKRSREAERRPASAGLRTADHAPWLKMYMIYIFVQADRKNAFERSKVMSTRRSGGMRALCSAPRYLRNDLTQRKGNKGLSNPRITSPNH